jgi:hypothetical protein
MKRASAGILGAALLIALAASPGLGQQTQTAASSKEALAVLNKMIEATGGRKLLESIKDTVVSGTVEFAQFGITAPITIYLKEPDKIRQDVTVAEFDMTFTQVFDGQKGWQTNINTGKTEEMPYEMAKELGREARGSLAILDPKKAGVVYALKPKAAIEGRDHIVLEQTYPDGHRVTFFLDPETYLPYKTQTKTFDPLGAEVDAESYSTNYQKVGGTMVAFSIRVLHSGSEAQKITVASVSYNTNLDDAIFVIK